MTRQQRITLEQVRSKKDEALVRMNDVLRKIADTPTEDNEKYQQLLRELGRARSDFDNWITVLGTLERRNPDLEEEISDEIGSYWVDDSSVVNIDSKWVSLVSEPSGGIIAVGRRDIIASLADLLQASVE